MGGCVLVLMLVVLVVVLSACGASGRDMPPAPAGPNEWRETGAEYLYQSCTPSGDRVYGYLTASGGVALTAVPGGCRP
jgi:hypothetical protein